MVAAGVLSGTAPFGFLISQLAEASRQVAINALEQQGLARSLAEPNLVALSGDTASFLAGGEFPVPVPGTLGQVSIDYKPYGVGLAFTPTVLRDGLINLVIKPEVSELDNSNPVQVAGISVPPLIVRQASTTVELRDGQSFMLGGLLQNISNNAQDQLPWLGDVPVLGALFRSRPISEERDRSRDPGDAAYRPPAGADRPIHTPLDNTLPANDVDFFLMGQAEVSPALAGSRSARSTGLMSGTSSICRKGRRLCPARTERAAGAQIASPLMLGAARRLLRHLLRPARYRGAQCQRRGRRQCRSRRWSIRGRRTAATPTSPSTASRCSGRRALSHRQGGSAGDPDHVRTDGRRQPPPRRHDGAMRRRQRCVDGAASASAQ